MARELVEFVRIELVSERSTFRETRGLDKEDTIAREMAERASGRPAQERGKPCN